jgi:hypothetical protein
VKLHRGKKESSERTRLKDMRDGIIWEEEGVSRRGERAGSAGDMIKAHHIHV